jgi:uncharacterized phage protein gp47/JayE
MATNSYTGFTRPTLTELTARIISDLNVNLPGEDANVRYSVLNVLANTEAGIVHEIYGYLDWISNQTNILYCTGENLDLFGNIWAVTRKAPTFASGYIMCTGVDGSIVPVGTTFQSSDGYQYIATGGTFITAGIGYFPAQALISGDDYNQSTNTILTMTSSLSGVESNAEILSMSGGTNMESDDLLRTRILDRIANPPHGGSQSDYVTWALQHPGVTRAWCYPNEMGLGTVTVRFMMDDTYEDGMPQPADITDVVEYIELYRPVTAEVYVVQPVGVALDVEVTNLTPNTPTVQANVHKEIVDMLKRRAEPGGTIFCSWIWEAVSLATGNQHHTITIPTTDIIYNVGELPVLGTVTFV